MAKYIDKDAILQDMKKRLNNVNHGDYIDYQFGYILAIRYIENAPTAAVCEVKHGHWDEIRGAYGKLEGWIHRDCGRMSMGKDNYCPKCGARMDLGEKNDK